MVNYPINYDDDTTLYFVTDLAKTTLSSDIDATQTSIPVTDTSKFPDYGIIRIGDELIKYTSKTPTSFEGCVRGYGGTTATSHSSNALVWLPILGEHHNVLKDSIIEIEKFVGVKPNNWENDDTVVSKIVDLEDRVENHTHPNYDSHISNFNNPHNVTLEQVRSKNNKIEGPIDFNNQPSQNFVIAVDDYFKNPVEGKIIYTTIDNHLYLYNGTYWKKILLEDDVGESCEPGGGEFNLKIADEGSVIAEKVKIIDFVGADVKAVSTVPGRVTIYIPTPSYPSHFNTTDGTTDARVNSITTSNRFVGNPHGDFYVGDWDLSTQHPTINTSSIHYETNEEFLVENTTETFEVKIIQDDVIASHSIVLDGDKTSTNNGITITTTNFGAVGDKYKIKIAVDVDLSTILPNGGRFKVQLIHHSTVDYTFEQEMFYDTNTNTITIQNVTYNISTENIKYLSGIKYYTTNTEYNLSVGDVDWLNYQTYVKPILEIDPTQIGVNSFNLNPEDLDNWTNDYDKVDVSYTATVSVNRSNYFFQGNGGYRVRAFDWGATSWQSSNTIPLLIDTYTPNSTRIYEDFRDENNRLTTTLQPWDSTQSLLTYDGGNGLQVKNSKLIYPQEDFSTYNPTGNPDYSSASGNRVYIRRIWHNGVNHSNGRFRIIGNITEDDITSKNVEIWISLDGNEWYTLNELYLGGSLSNGSGCRVNADQYNLDTNNQIAFTLGEGKFTDETTGGGWGLYVKIIFNENAKNKYIDVFEEVTWI